MDEAVLKMALSLSFCILRLPAGAASARCSTPGRSDDATGSRRDRELLMTSTQASFKPLRALGGFHAMALDTLVLIPRRPFAWREFLLQSWFVARVSMLPTVMLAIPFTVLLVFTFNILLLEFGAADYSGTGAAYGTVTQVGPVVTVLVVAGARATSMCADLGARTIREELDALRVTDINPIQVLVVPRVPAATFIALMLSSVVILVGIIGGFFYLMLSTSVPNGWRGPASIVVRALAVDAGLRHSEAGVNE